jgi:hypothetical protein
MAVVMVVMMVVMAVVMMAMTVVEVRVEAETDVHKVPALGSPPVQSNTAY